MQTCTQLTVNQPRSKSVTIVPVDVSAAFACTAFHGTTQACCRLMTRREYANTYEGGRNCLAHGRILLRCERCEKTKRLMFQGLGKFRSASASLSATPPVPQNRRSSVTGNTFEAISAHTGPPASRHESGRTVPDTSRLTPVQFPSSLSAGGRAWRQSLAAQRSSPWRTKPSAPPQLSPC